VAIIRSLDEVPAALAAHPGPVGFWGISHGARVGLRLLAAGPRITAAVLGLADGPIASAPLVTASMLFYVQSDDDLVQPDACRALFDALGSTDKSMIENAGGHLDLPRASIEESAVWLDRKLADPSA
jgi:dienelactone hydrolase